METVTLARHAMASRFEMVLIGKNPARLRAAGEEALDEIDRIEGELSLYRPASQIARVNALAARMPVRVTPEVYGLLEHASTLNRITDGAFDVTVAPLVRAWGFMDGCPRQPDAAELEALRRVTGMRHLILNSGDQTVQFDSPGVMLDLGAIGKGYAIEKASELLREAGVERALLHGGTSTVCAIGAPPDASGWRIAIESPTRERSVTPTSMQILRSAAVLPECGAAPVTPPLFAVELCDNAFSVSSPSGKCFESENQLLGHVIDPVTGRPGNTGLLGAIMLPSATETDALSTGLLVLGGRGCELLRAARPAARFWFVDARMRVMSSG